MNPVLQIILAISGAIVFLGLYFVPTIVALKRGIRRNKKAIFALNFFLGWTALGWIGALVWALMEDTKITLYGRHIIKKSKKEISGALEEAFPDVEEETPVFDLLRNGSMKRTGLISRRFGRGKVIK